MYPSPIETWKPLNRAFLLERADRDDHHLAAASIPVVEYGFEKQRPN